MPATERIPVLVPAREKALIAQRAAEAGLSMGAFMRRAAQAYRPEQDEALFEKLIEQMNQATEQAATSVDKTMNAIAASNRRLATLDASRKSRT